MYFRKKPSFQKIEVDASCKIKGKGRKECCLLKVVFKRLKSKRGTFQTSCSKDCEPFEALEEASSFHSCQMWSCQMCAEGFSVFRRHPNILSRASVMECLAGIRMSHGHPNISRASEMASKLPRAFSAFIREPLALLMHLSTFDLTMAMMVPSLSLLPSWGSARSMEMLVSGGSSTWSSSRMEVLRRRRLAHGAVVGHPHDGRPLSWSCPLSHAGALATLVVTADGSSDRCGSSTSIVRVI
jgi:hypothetical protein